MLNKIELPQFGPLHEVTKNAKENIDKEKTSKAEINTRSAQDESEIILNKAKSKVNDLETIQNIRTQLGIVEINKTETERIKQELINAKETVDSLQPSIKQSGRKIIFSPLNDNRLEENPTKDSTELSIAEQAFKNFEGFVNAQTTPMENVQSNFDNIQAGIDFWNSTAEKYEKDMLIAENAMNLSDEEFKKRYGEVITREAAVDMYNRRKKMKEEAEMVSKSLIEKMNSH